MELRKLKNFKMSEYFAISDEIDEYLSELSDEIINILPEGIDVQSISFLLYELLINIYKHSKFENAYIRIDVKDEIEIQIIDDGIGIPGSFREANISFENDSEAIFEAINGKTTDKEKFNLHGRGLNSSARIVTMGFGGEMSISSGFGICEITPNGAKIYFNEYEENGTFITLKIYNKKVEKLYECLKFEKINKLEVKT